jgi:hypothetical protein
MRTDGRVFCSRTCSNRAQSAALRAHPELRAPAGTMVTCEQCGQGFAVKPHKVGKTRFCSRTCTFRWRFGKPGHPLARDVTGTANPNYRGTANRTTARLTATGCMGDRLALHGLRLRIAVDVTRPRAAPAVQRPENLDPLPEPSPPGPSRFAHPAGTPLASSRCSCCTIRSPTPVVHHHLLHRSALPALAVATCRPVDLVGVDGHHLRVWRSGTMAP